MAIDASGYQFQFYSKGIYSSKQCDSTHLNHAMLVIGYGSYYDSKYWIIKNRYSAWLHLVIYTGSSSINLYYIST